MRTDRPDPAPPEHPPRDHAHGRHHRHLTPEQERWRDEQRRVRDERNRVSIRRNLALVGGFLVVAAIVGFLWLQSVAEQRAQRDALAARHAELRRELLADNLLTPADAPALLQRIEALRSEWEAGPDASAIAQQAQKAHTVIANAAASARLTDELGGLQRAFEAAGTRTEPELRALHERAAALRPRLPKNAAGPLAQLDGIAARIDAAWFDALLADGAAADRPAKAAVELLTAAWDLGEQHVDAAQHDAAAKQAWSQRLQALRPKFDAAQRAALEPAAVAAVPWQDVHAAEADWVLSKTKALSRRVDGGALSIDCAGGDNTHSGIVELRHQAWHACAVSFDVQVERGKVAVYPRARSSLGEHDGGGLVLATAATAGATVLPAGQTVHVEATVVGDRLVADVGTTPPQHLEQTIQSHERHGSFAVLVHADSALTVRNLRVRRLG